MKLNVKIIYKMKKFLLKFCFLLKNIMYEK